MQAVLPLSAAAAVTALSLVRDEDLAEKANKTAAELRKALTRLAALLAARPEETDVTE